MVTLRPGSVQIISDTLRAASVASATTTNVSLLKSSFIIHFITGHSANMFPSLQAFHNLVLVLRKYPDKSISLLDLLIYWKSCNNSTLFCFDRVMTKMHTCLFQSQASDQCDVELDMAFESVPSFEVFLENESPDIVGICNPPVHQVMSFDFITSPGLLHGQQYKYVNSPDLCLSSSNVQKYVEEPSRISVKLNSGNATPIVSLPSLTGTAGDANTASFSVTVKQEFIQHSIIKLSNSTVSNSKLVGSTVIKSEPCHKGSQERSKIAESTATAQLSKVLPQISLSSSASMTGSTGKLYGEACVSDEEKITLSAGMLEDATTDDVTPKLHCENKECMYELLHPPQGLALQKCFILNLQHDTRVNIIS
ncbi:hypothetical protein KIW84_043383 [Lathyrus oleraceus]|uniref:Uncharacterized protein n=1 Tax=Pisum sativum TaxID=3888 RepID=A0A9D4XHU3_PEA|nr:hypothetical protein KIW84_043383 [Pisum sativum]